MKLFRLLIVILLLFIVIGCSADPIDKLISSTTLKSAAPFTIYNTEVQKGKNINGGIYVQGSVKVPFDIPRKKIKPTALAALKQLKKQIPNSQWFKLYLVPEGKAGDHLQIDVARAEFVNNQFVINYSTLSATEATKLVQRAANGEAISDIPISLTKTHFDAAVMISIAYNQFYKSSHDPESAYEQAAALLQSDIKTVKKMRSQAMNYYTYGQEQETIK
ncbi:MAG: hypothetical protein GY710_08135 [Desulfobacteraceae bacterium]|nr:hypothetical protein [Desulfobacteraceae bacterium]